MKCYICKFESDNSFLFIDEKYDYLINGDKVKALFLKKRCVDVNECYYRKIDNSDYEKEHTLLCNELSSGWEEDENGNPYYDCHCGKGHFPGEC